MGGLGEELTDLLLILGEALPLRADGCGSIGDLGSDIAGGPTSLGEEGIRSTRSLRLTIIMNSLKLALGEIVLKLQLMAGPIGIGDLDGGEALDPRLVVGR